MCSSDCKNQLLFTNQKLQRLEKSIQLLIKKNVNLESVSLERTVTDPRFYSIEHEHFYLLQFYLWQHKAWNTWFREKGFYRQNTASRISFTFSSVFLVPKFLGAAQSIPGDAIHTVGLRHSWATLSLLNSNLLYWAAHKSALSLLLKLRHGRSVFSKTFAI